MPQTVPISIDHNAINRWKVKLTLQLMSFEELDEAGQQEVLHLAYSYFTRIGEVLQFLVYVRGINNLKTLLPPPFFLPNIFSRTHLAMQRSGAKYDGKYYILDLLGPNETLVTDMRFAEVGDLRKALVEFDEVDGLQQLIWQLDKQTNPATNSTP